MSKRKDGVFSLLRQILAEQKEQTKILQAIESSQEYRKNKKHLEAKFFVNGEIIR